MNSVLHPERDRLEQLEELLTRWKDQTLRALEETGEVRGIDDSYAERFEDTARRLLELSGELHVEDWDPEALAEARGIILEALTGLNEPNLRPLDRIDDFLVRAEALRHLVRDALDAHVDGADQDAKQLMAALRDWLPGVAQKDVADLVGRTPKTLQRWAKDGGAPNRRLRLVTRMVALLRRSWTPEGIVAWFYRHRRDLDGQRPVDVLDDPDFERQLLIAVRQGRAQHGA